MHNWFIKITFVWEICVCVCVHTHARVYVYMCACMCLAACKGMALITIHVKDTSISSSTAFHFIYMILSINKMDGHGFSNTACHKYLSKKTKVTWY